MRFARLRSTALGSLRLAAIIPSLAPSPSLLRNKMVKYLSRLVCAPAKTRLYANSFGSLCFLGNVCRGGFLVLSVMSAVTGVRCLRYTDYGVSCARPLARRRLSTSRPALVAMRARKPCVRARLMRLGWNVRFMSLLPGYAGHTAPGENKAGKGTRRSIYCQ